MRGSAVSELFNTQKKIFSEEDMCPALAPSSPRESRCHLRCCVSFRARQQRGEQRSGGCYLVIKL